MQKSMVFMAILCQVLKCSETYCNYPEFVILEPLLILKMHRCSQSNQRTGGRALWATKKNLRLFEHQSFLLSLVDYDESDIFEILRRLSPWPLSFSPILFCTWGLDPRPSACSHAVVPHLSLYLGHLLFRGAASLSYLWTKTALERPWIYQGLRRGKQREVNLEQ